MLIHGRQIFTNTAFRVLFWLILLFVLTFFLFPLYWLMLTSLKTFRDAFALPPKIFFIPTFENYIDVFTGKQLYLYIFNSTFVVVGSMMLSLILGLPGAYALAQFEFRGRRQIGLFVLGVRVAPPILSLFPLYIIFSRIGLIGSRTALIVMYMVFNLPLAIWLMIAFFREIPGEIREAALIDGCREFQIFRLIVIPLVKSGLAATSILCVIQAWNEYIVALVLTKQSTQTLPVVITSFMTYSGIEWGPISAAGVIVTIPMFVFGLLAQKNLVKGLTLGAVKG